MVTFEAGEFEIALCTYNRSVVVEEWLERCYEQTFKRGIHLSIWDSSTNDETEDLIRQFKMCRNDEDIEYHRVESDITIGYKAMLPLLNSNSKHVWVSGDSRCQDFDVMDEKVFPHILNGDVDCVVLHVTNNEENDGKIYTDKDELLYDCFLSMISLGMIIYKTAMFEPLIKNAELRIECDRKYKGNYGMAWLGYFLEVYALREYRTVFAVVPVENIRPDLKKFNSWFKKKYHCIIENLCDLMDGLSGQYQCTERVIRNYWKILSEDIPCDVYDVRKYGDLNQETYKKYKDNGMLDRCTKRGRRLERFAYASDEELDQILEEEKEIEKKEFEALCRQNMEKIRTMSEGGELWIYGAGTGGKIMARCLTEHKIPVRGFLDKQAESMVTCEGLPVRLLDDINRTNCFIVISLMIWRQFVVRPLLDAGIKRNQIFWVSMESD